MDSVYDCKSEVIGPGFFRFKAEIGDSLSHILKNFHIPFGTTNLWKVHTVNPFSDLFKCLELGVISSDLFADFNGVVLVQNYLSRTGREEWAKQVIPLLLNSLHFHCLLSWLFAYTFLTSYPIARRNIVSSPLRLPLHDK